MIIENLNEYARVTIVGNKYGIRPDPVGCTGGLVGYTDDGRPIVDFFNPKDGELHAAAFDKGDVRVG